MCRLGWHRVLFAARWMAILLCAVMFVHCKRADNYVISNDVNVRQWDERVELEFEHGQERERCDMDIVLHVNRTFKHREVAFEITLFTPDSLRYSEFISSEIDVEWGPTARYYHDLPIEYRRDVELAKEGSYRVAIRPLYSLSGVESAGINFRMK